MAQGTTPVVQQRLLRAELRKAREDTGHTQKQVADELGWSLSKVIRLETGATAASTSDVMALIQFYKIKDDARAQRLIDVTRAKASEWWDEYSSYYEQEFMTFLAYEDAAISLRQFQTHAIPGLLQTADYARGVFDVFQPDTERIERAVKVRMRRGRLLTRGKGTRFDFILDEAAIHRLVTSAEVMIAQLTRLKDVNDAGDPLISIRVVPFTIGVNTAMRRSFTIFELPSDDEDFVINVDEPKRDALIRDNPESTSQYFEAFADLEELALDRASTNELLDSVIQSIRPNPPS